VFESGIGLQDVGI